MLSAFVGGINNSWVVLQKQEQCVLWLSPMCSRCLVLRYQKVSKDSFLPSHF